MQRIIYMQRMINATDDQRYNEADSWSSGASRQKQSQPKYYTINTMDDQHNG
jgi:hypothetical protein